MDKVLLQKVERLVDEKYLSLAMPHLDWTLVVWYLLTSLEDYQIWMFREAAKNEALAHGLGKLIDRLKYSIKYALLRARKEVVTDSCHEVPRAVVPMLYSRASEIIQEGVSYSTAMRIISTVYGKKVKLIEKNGAIELNVVDEIYHDLSYSVLEMLGHIEPDTITYSLILYTWLKSPESQPLVLNLIAETVSLKKRILRYDYSPELAYRLAQELSQQPFLIPDKWRFEWGGRYETTLLLNSLCIRCVYHIVAIEYGARRFNLKGGGHESLVLVLTREQLISDLIEMCSLDESTVGLFVDCLSFGNRVDSPDPALQPMLELSGNRIALPCLHIITSHLERNLLTLQARQSPKQFDALSDLFEIKMIEGILSKIGDRWPLNKVNVHVSLAGVTEELDLVLVDPASQSIFIGELRWMLPPGDPREVQHKKKVCGEKVVQLRRKYNFIRENLGEFLSGTFNISSGDSVWEVYGAVVIEGFGGVRSSDADLPVLIKYIAEIGLSNSETLRQFGVWGQSLDWLPREDTHYEQGYDQIETNEEGIKYSTVSISCTPEEYRAFLVESLKKFGSQGSDCLNT